MVHEDLWNDELNKPIDLKLVWEYKFLYKANVYGTSEEFNALGKDGWELKAFDFERGTGIFARVKV